MTLFVAAMAMTVNAQVYLGGSVGVGSVKFGHNDAETTYKFMPEIGYIFSSKEQASFNFMATVTICSDF